MQRYVIVLFVCACTGVALAQPKVTSESQKAREFWSQNVKGKPVNLIFGDRQLIRMYLFSGQSGVPSNPRDVAIADLLHRVGGSSVLRGPINEAAFTQRASELLGRAPDEGQSEALAALYKKIFDEYSAMRSKEGVGIMIGTFGLAGVANLHETLKSTRTMEDAFARAAKYHGWNCDLRKLTNVSFETVRESIDRKLPLLFENDSMLYVCFGYVLVENKPYLLLNEPGTTPLISDPPYISSGDRESISPFVIKGWRGLMKERPKGGPADIDTVPSLALPPAGFLIEPYDAKGWTVWVVENYRYSASAWDNEIKVALKLADVPAPSRATIPVTGKRDEDMWNKYILGQPEKVRGPYGLVPTAVLPPGLFDQDRAALFSVMTSQMGSRPSELAFTAQRLYRWACDKRGEVFLDLDKEKLEQLKALYEKLLSKYELNQRSVRADADAHPNALYAAGLRLNAAVDKAQSLGEMLKNIEKNNGWAATLESSDSMTFAAYKKAINSGTQVMVVDKSGKWRLVVGYLNVDKSQMLLLVDPSLIGREVLTLDKNRLFPDAGVYFEDFEEGKYKAFMAHSWRTSADPYASEIMAIFPPETQPATVPASKEASEQAGSPGAKP